MTSSSFRSSARSPRSGKTPAGRRLRRHNKLSKPTRRNRPRAMVGQTCAFCKRPARMILGFAPHCGEPHVTRPGWK